MPVGAVPFPFGKCRICKDRATGVHYGVATCEGCKGFFKRSITKAEKYKCFFGGECDVTPKNRNRCKSCRFRLCLENGMSVEAVRMGRIPKIEKEKALEAVQAAVVIGDGDQNLPVNEDFNDFPKYCAPTSGSYSRPSGSSFPSEPEIYDFDTGCISRQKSTIEDVTSGMFPETVTQPFQAQRLLLEEGPPLDQTPASSGSCKVKQEFSSSETSSCHFSQYGKPSSMEIHESSKTADLVMVERNHNTYQYSNISSDPLLTATSFTPNHQYNLNETSCQAQTQNKSDSDKLCVQNPVSCGVESQSSFIDKSCRNPNQLSLRDSGLTFSNTSQYVANDPGLFNQTGKFHGIPGNHSISLNSQYGHGCNPPIGSRIEPSLNNNSNPQKDLPTENLVQKQEPIDNEFSETLIENEIHVSGTSTMVTPSDITNFEKDFDQMVGLHLTQNKPHPYKVQEIASPVKTSRPTLTALSRCNSERSLSSSFPPTCPTPSSIDGSTTSSQRSRFSPGLIKVLLEHVLDSTQDPDVSMRLKQRLEQNRVDKGVVANVLNLIREVSAKRNKHLGSEESAQMSPTATSSELSTVLSESKMENIQRFLEDVNKFSRPGPLHSPPFGGRQNCLYSTPSTSDRQNSDLRLNCPIKKRLFRCENAQKFTDCEQQSTLGMEQSKEETCLYDLDNHNIAKASSQLNDEVEEESDTLKHKLPAKKYTLPEINLIQCEQSKLVESSHFEELAPHNSPQPCHLIEQSINENLVTCSDDKLTREEVKKQVVQMTIEGLSFASKILNRLKPEHREKLRLWKLGLLKIRVLSTQTEEGMRETYQKIIDGIQPLNDRILGFCEQVPGFSSINAEDRAILMKRAYYDIWMLNTSEYFFGNEICIILESGEIYNRKAMEKILNKEITKTLVEFAGKFKKLDLSDLEISILCAVRLTCSDDLEVKDRSTIQKLHSLMLDVLAIEIERNHPDHARLLITIFELMPLLAITNKMQCQIIAKYRLDKPSISEHEDDEKNVDSTV